MFTKLRDQLTHFWQNQSQVQRIVLLVLVTAGIVLIPVFISWANTPSYGVAFSGLSEATAGQIVEKLNEVNVSYQLRGSGTILVPSDKVYEVRLQMAREGLPQEDTIGFEIFSGNTLGMTDFTQQVNYQRAMEGELERTISSLASVKAVRVHIVMPERTLLSENQSPTTASITIQKSYGDYLDAAQVRSITHLVASSVEGLQPEHVVVVDVDGNLLAAGLGDEGGASSQADNRRAAELAAARELQNKVQNLLDSALGPNRSVVQAYVTLDWTEREITTQAYDPDTASIRSSQVISESYATTGGLVGGIPGAEPNLPGGLEEDVSGETGTNYQRFEEINNYELTQTQTHEFQTPGEIERVSLSVLVDGITNTQQLDTLQAVVGAAAGIDTDRGDVLTVETLDFDRSYYETQAAEMDTSQQTDLYIKIGQAVAAILILGALLWYIQRLLTNLRLESAQAWTPVLRPVSEVALPVSAVLPQIAKARKKTPSPISAEPQPELETYLPVERDIQIAQPSQEDEQLQHVINRLSDDDPASVAEILQSWLNEAK